MTVEQRLIEDIQKVKKSIEAISVYNISTYSMLELYYQIARKINELIRELNRFEDTIASEVIEQNKKLLYLLNEGLRIEVGKKLNEMLADGTLADIINQEVFGELNSQLGFIKKQYVNVLEFGAKNSLTDPTFDNSLPFTNAMTYALENKIENIFIPSGVYNFKNQLEIKGKLNYFGYNSELVSTLETSYFFTKEDDFYMEALTFNANGVCMRAFHMQNSQNFKLKKCIFKNATKYGLHGEQIKKGNIQDCKFENSGRNDFMSSSCAINGSDINIESCEASGNTKGNGFMIYADDNFSSNSIIVSNCLAKLNAQHGFVTTSMALCPGVVHINNNIKIKNCNAYNNGTNKIFSGISLHYTRNSQAVGCSSFNNEEHGIVVMDSDNTLVENNNIFSNKRCGVRLQADWNRAQDLYSGVRKCTISNNQIIENGSEDKYDSSAILIEGNCHYIKCNDNIISKNYYSIYIKKVTNYSDCTNIYLTNNVIYSNIISDDLTKTVTTSSIFQDDYVNSKKVNTNNVTIPAGYKSESLTEKVVGGVLSVENEVVYHAVTGETIVINGLDKDNYPIGTKFYICFKSGSSTGSITINDGTGLTLPNGTLVINKTNGNNEMLFTFLKTNGTNFRLIG